MALKFLVGRPKATLMAFVALGIFGALGYWQLPLSLMPATEAPLVRVEVSYPQGSPQVIEQSVLGPLRLAFQGLYRLDDMESIAGTGAGQIDLHFAYGTDMRLAYIEANEKLDLAIGNLPTDLPRPVIRRVEPTDIPIMRLHATSESYSIMELSELGQYVLLRRLEQVPGVAFVGMNGAVQPLYRVVPDQAKLQARGLGEQDLASAISRANASLYQVKAQDGIYEYDVKFDNLLANADNLSKVALSDKSGKPVLLTEVATIAASHAQPLGMHYANGSRGLVFAVHKQATASLLEVEKTLQEVVQELQKDYPQVVFDITQNQTELLRDSLYQLLVSLTTGAVLAVLILFAFNAEARSPLLMGALIPVSLLIAGAGMYIFGLSLNIISLSGMILGVGIIIDNGIIIIDNIGQKSKRGMNLSEACVAGAGELAPALLSSTVTTLCVFVPMLAQPGMAGVLFREQVITLALVLAASLAVALAMLPVLYHLVQPNATKADSRVYNTLYSKYKKSQKHGTGKITLAAFAAVLMIGAIALYALHRSNLPPIGTHDMSLKLEWKQQLTLEESHKQIAGLIDKLDAVQEWEVDLGRSNIWEEGINSMQRVQLYLSFDKIKNKENARQVIENALANHLPPSIWQIARAKNPYDQLFGIEKPYVTLRFRSTGDLTLTEDDVPTELKQLFEAGEGMQEQQGMEVVFHRARLEQMGLTPGDVLDKIRTQLEDNLITQVTSMNRQIPIVMRGNEQPAMAKYENLQIKLNDSTYYPVTAVCSFSPVSVHRYITADKAGVYQQYSLAQGPAPDQGIALAREYAVANGFMLSVAGGYLNEKDNLLRLAMAFAFAVLLLYVVLSAQFESFKLPLVILAEIPISASGSLILLWVTGSTINISSILGMVIMLGIIVNDSILKVDTILRHTQSGMSRREAVLQAGGEKLKPIIMTSLTTILAMVPILFGSGFGADLQFPLAIAVIGGLTVGTFCSVYLLPWLFLKLGGDSEK